MKNFLYLTAFAALLVNQASFAKEDVSEAAKDCQKAAHYFVLHGGGKHTHVTAKGHKFANTLAKPSCNIASDLIKKAKETELYKEALKNLLPA